MMMRVMKKKPHWMLIKVMEPTSTERANFRLGRHNGLKKYQHESKSRVKHLAPHSFVLSFIIRKANLSNETFFELVFFIILK